MKLGLLTAAFPDTPLTDVADWAAANGFAMLEVASWPRSDGPSRRYAGVSHIDCADLSDGEAKELVDDLAERGIAISALGYYPNPLSPDLEHRAEVIAHLRHVIEAAAKLGVPVVNTFIGNDKDKPLNGELRRVREGVARHRRERCRPRREDRHRELPDDLQLRRVAGRQQPDARAGDVAGRLRRPRWRHARPQPRSVAPRVADDRLRARRARVRRAASTTSTPRTWRSIATGSTTAASCRRAWGGRCRGCPAR